MRPTSSKAPSPENYRQRKRLHFSLYLWAMGWETDYEMHIEVKVAQLRLTLCDHIDYAVHGILQARILKWVAIPFSRGSSQPRDWTQVSCIAGRFFTESPGKPWIGKRSLKWWWLKVKERKSPQKWNERKSEDWSENLRWNKQPSWLAQFA